MKRFELKKLKCESVENETPRLDLEAESNMIKDVLQEHFPGSREWNGPEWGEMKAEGPGRCGCHSPVRGHKSDKAVEKDNTCWV